MGLAIFLFVGGAVICVWIYLWLRQRQELGQQPAAEVLALEEVPAASSDDAILVSREHGQLVYVNERARRWLGMNGTTPNLEIIAQVAQPPDSFLGLFAHEFQSSFQLGPRWVEASSHRVPGDDGMRTVVVMRELGSQTANPKVLDLAQAIALINRIGETVNASLGVEQVLQVLLEVVNADVKADAGEICLWNAEAQVMEPRGWLGDATYVLKLSASGGVYHVGEGISGWIAKHRQPVLSVDPDSPSAVMPLLPDNGYSSFVGVPLEVGERFIGTFELASALPDAFSQKEVALLQAISKQVAIAIYNAELYAAQSQHIENLTGLQDALEQAKDKDYAHAVYRALSERLAQLIGTDICGILQYDDFKQALLPKLPFYGIPDQITRRFSIPTPPNSPQFRIWQNQPYWVSNDIADEPMVETLQYDRSGQHRRYLQYRPDPAGSRQPPHGHHPDGQ